MREIKFKAWLKGIDKMTYAHTLEELMNWDTKKEENGTAIWLQYTGLKDKNGKEIYEGDIVKSVDEDLNPQIYTIIWSEARACFDMKLGYSARIFFPLSHVMEVIGNTYENPDLLK